MSNEAGDHVLDALDGIRARARAIVRSVEPSNIRVLAIVELVDEIRSSLGSDAWWGQRAVWAEAGDFLLTGRVAEPPAEVYRTPKWIAVPCSLRAKGYQSCPTCWTLMPDSETSERLTASDRAAWDEATRFENAARAVQT